MDRPDRINTDGHWTDRQIDTGKTGQTDGNWHSGQTDRQKLDTIQYGQTQTDRWNPGRLDTQINVH